MDLKKYLCRKRVDSIMSFSFSWSSWPSSWFPFENVRTAFLGTLRESILLKKIIHTWKFYEHFYPLENVHAFLTTHLRVYSFSTTTNNTTQKHFNPRLPLSYGSKLGLLFVLDLEIVSFSSATLYTQSEGL